MWYVVIDRNGKVKHTNKKQGHTRTIYTTEAKAQAQCKSPGDSVMEIVIDFTKEPLFINKRYL